MPGAHSRRRPPAAYTMNGGVRIHYQTEGKGPPLVLHHWSLSTLQRWYDYGNVSALNSEYGWSFWMREDMEPATNPRAYQLAKRVGDIRAVLDDLEIDQAHFPGYSMGGRIGSGIAQHALQRFRSLIIGGQHARAQSMVGLRNLVQFGAENGPEGFVAMWEGNYGTLSA